MLNFTNINSIIKSFEKAVKDNYPYNIDGEKPEVTFTTGPIVVTMKLSNMPFTAIRIDISETTSGIIIDLFWTRDYNNWFTSFRDETPVETMIRDAMIPWHMDIISQYVKK